jgi:hypothetical protein
MKIVNVTYTTKPEFVETNSKNIQNVMQDLQDLNSSGILYTSCLAADGKTFRHTAFFKTDEDQKALNELPSFKNFQEQLKASGLESPPKQELFTLVGTSKQLFN